MKTVYFVRHGESKGNVGDLWQDASAPLTANGREQARAVATRLMDKEIDVIISSTMVRGKETSEIMGKKLGKPVEYSDVLIERRRPKEQIGQEKDSVSVAFIGEAVRTNFHNPNFRFSDEENFTDLKKRSGELLNLLVKRKEENIVVVTHEFFMRMIIAYISMGDKLTPDEGEQFVRTFHLLNTGLTIVKENKGDNNSSWDVCTWNDYSHLDK